jgi:hypothetical protein
LSASQRNMGLCGGKGGSPPACLCRLLSRLLAPQLPAALAPPALAGALGALLYAAAWLLHASAPLTLPLALWLLFAADGRPALAPGPLAAAAALHPVAGSGAARLQAAAAALPRVSRPAAAALLALLLLALRAAEGALLRRRQRRVEASARAVTAAQVQARYAGWRLPGADDGAAAATDAGAAAARQLAAELRAEVEGAWRSVFDSPPPPELTGCPQGEGAALPYARCALLGHWRQRAPGSAPPLHLPPTYDPGQRPNKA